jgi:adenylate cyclase
MFTDMVGYSALAQRDDKLALELLEEHRLLLREIFPRFHGTEIKTIGDGFLVEFHSALEAAECAVEIQQSLFRRNQNTPFERRIKIRIGVHIGDVVHRENDVYGDGVNIASRIEQLAGPGGICVSMDVERQIRNTLEARFEKLAPTELKNISIPMDLFRIILPWENRAPILDQSGTVRAPASRKFLVAVVALIFLLMIGVGWWWSDRPHGSATLPAAMAISSVAASIPAKSIAVLPFENLSRDPDNAFFAEGVQDEILTRLANVADLKVIARTSTGKFKSAPENLPDIAKQLGVANILEGSVQKAGDQVRVNVQLINALTNTHIWAEIYDRRLTDIFGVESDIARSVADALKAKLTGSEQTEMSKKPTENSEAYELYLKGRFFWNKRTGEDLKTAADYFRRAVEVDPQYAAAYAGLAQTYVVIPLFAAGMPSEYLPKAKTAAQRAIELDETSAEAHTALGLLLCFSDVDFPAAEMEFKRAIAINPNYATAHHWYGNCLLLALGRFDEAISENQRAVELDPLSLIINADLGGTLTIARRYDQAIAQLRRTLGLDERFGYAHWNLGQALYLKGETAAAIAEYEKARSLGEDPQIIGLLGRAYAETGQRDKAMELLRELEQRPKHEFVRGYIPALIYIGLGDNAQAIDCLEREYLDHDNIDTAWIRVDPMFDPLRGDPRFERLADKIVPKSQFKASTSPK